MKVVTVMQGLPGRSAFCTTSEYAEVHTGEKLLPAGVFFVAEKTFRQP